MGTIKELREELRIQRILLDAKREQASIGTERKQIRKNIKRVRRERRFGGAFAFARKVGRVAVKTGRVAGRAAVLSQRALQNLEKPKRRAPKRKIVKRKRR